MHLLATNLGFDARVPIYENMRKDIPAVIYVFSCTFVLVMHVCTNVLSLIQISWPILFILDIDLPWLFVQMIVLLGNHENIVCGFTLLKQRIISILSDE